MTESIVLYDFDNRAHPHTCWSFNVWKSRLLLNRKNIPYTTFWTDHTALGSTLAALGMRPRAEGSPYTVPTIRTSDGLFITESALIADKLEELYPTPSLRLDKELQAEADQVATSIAMPLFANYMPRLAREVIPLSALPGFVTSRKEKFGMSPDEMEKQRGGEPAWKAAEPGFQAMRDILTKHKVDDGPFIRGSQLCYADFVLVALLEAFRRATEDIFERVIGQDESFRKLYDACKQWTERAD